MIIDTLVVRKVALCDNIYYFLGKKEQFSAMYLNVHFVRCINIIFNDMLISYSSILFHIYRLNSNIIEAMRLMRLSQKENHFCYL